MFHLMPRRAPETAASLDLLHLLLLPRFFQLRFILLPLCVPKQLAPLVLLILFLLLRFFQFPFLSFVSRSSLIKSANTYGFRWHSLLFCFVSNVWILIDSCSE